VILQALVDYYNRKQGAQAGSLAMTGWEHREVAFVIELDEHGKGTLLDRRSPERKRGELLLVPAAEIRSGTDAWKKPNLLWDHMGFVLGWQKRLPDGSPDPSDKPEKVANQHQAFIARLRILGSEYAGSAGLRAMLRFYDQAGPESLQPQELCDQLLRAPGLNITFKLRSQVDPICHESWVMQLLSGQREDPEEGQSTIEGTCLVTGEPGILARLHPKISFVAAKPSPLVAANTNEAPAYSSYGKAQALNAPVSMQAASQYTIALNALLGRGSPNKLQIADATTVIWADRDDSVEPELLALFGDDPDAHVDAVRQRLAGASAGSLGTLDQPLRFFVLGLAPNASRISVRFWFNDTFDRLAPRILQHFADLRIFRQSDRDAATPSLYWLLRSVAPQGKAENVPPRLAGEWLRAILEGTPYPPALLNAAVNRCRAEQASDAFGGNVPYERAAILKACINREHRRRHGLPPGFQFIQEELDVTQTDPGYRLGRLFAVLESIQTAAQGRNINATIRDRYYGAASSTPAAVYPTLLRLKNAHLKKLSPAQETRFENLLGEICGSLEQPLLADFPRQLDLHAQGLFALGYYHQRQSLFAPRAGSRDTDDNPAEEN
jgi:CRISPR-associated protein Csd1